LFVSRIDLEKGTPKVLVESICPKFIGGAIRLKRNTTAYSIHLEKRRKWQTNFGGHYKNQYKLFTKKQYICEKEGK
jgi:hypothetical protein